MQTCALSVLLSELMFQNIYQHLLTDQNEELNSTMVKTVTQAVEILQC